jgi:hypothetical protein
MRCGKTRRTLPATIGRFSAGPVEVLENQWDKGGEESSFCEQKEAKKLYSFWFDARPRSLTMSHIHQVFLLLVVHKKRILPLLSRFWPISSNEYNTL